MNLRCYCCGAQLHDTFALVTSGRPENTDRVFVMTEPCALRADGEVQIVTRRREPKEPADLHALFEIVNGLALDAIAGVLRRAPREPGESDASYRNRVRP